MAECGRVDPDGQRFTRTSSDSRQLQPWKQHIILQLKNRDQTQKILYQDLIGSYLSLLERCTQNAYITKGLLSPPRPLLPSSTEDILSSLKTATGELAYQVVELQQEIKIKDAFLEKQHARMCETQNCLSAVQLVHNGLQGDVQKAEEGIRMLKSDYDSLHECYQHLDQDYREKKLHGSDLVEDLVRWKQQAAARMNHRNEKKLRAREAGRFKELEKKIHIDEVTKCASSPTSPLSSRSECEEKLDGTHSRLFRSASDTSPRILGSIRGLFEKKRRGNSVCNLEEDLYTPPGLCLAARVPARAIHSLDAHELGINAVRFSPSSSLLATGGTDRVIKLWDVSSGMLHNRRTLDGSNDSITSIEFDPTGSRILAASYDKSALFWQLDNSVPKMDALDKAGLNNNFHLRVHLTLTSPDQRQFTLTGHSRKVTAARFKYNLQQVVTGSADRTVKIWDLHRTACIQTIKVFSYCSDVVCSEYYIISGHFDRKIRFWDSRAASCTQEVPLQGKVTSLDISPSHRELLTCSRDESLQLVDLRMSNARMVFRAEGFKCGSDSTKAIFSPDGSYLAAGSADGAVYIWNINTGKLETRLPDMHRSSINAVAWSMSGQYVVSVDKSRYAILWSDI